MQDNVVTSEYRGGGWGGGLGGAGWANGEVETFNFCFSWATAA